MASNQQDEMSDAERAHLANVMKRAKEVESQDLRKPIEGTLNKYTNVVKGWQFRYFILDSDRGVLSYYMSEEQYVSGKAQRGSIQLAGAVVSPSDEDSQTFAVSAVCGDIYRLRANDARERHTWVTRLRATAEYHTQRLAEEMPSVPAYHNGGTQPSVLHHYTSTTDQFGQAIRTGHKPTLPSPQPSAASGYASRGHTVAGSRRQCGVTSVTSVTPHGTFHSVKEMLGRAEQQQRTLSMEMDKLNSIDKEMLTLRATSLSTMFCLEQCLGMLESQHMRNLSSASPSLGRVKSAGSPAATGRSRVKPPTTAAAALSGFINDKITQPLYKIDRQLSELGRISSGAASAGRSASDASGATTSPTSRATLPTTLAGINNTVVDISVRDEETDGESEVELDLGAVDEHKPVILHLLSQLKLGMDLTRVVLPTFILEKRSLLEMFADFLAHPDMFLKISDGDSAESRMLLLFEWFVTALHAGRRGGVAKKPYNPIIGETFHCSWRLSRDPQGDRSDPPGDRSDSQGDRSDPQGDRSDSQGDRSDQQSDTYIRYAAEQVSHHPPVTAFYVECPDKSMCMNASIWTKSKFMGLSIGVVMVGELYVHLLSHNESYVITLPSAFARSILTVPWVELGGRTTITCDSTPYTATLNYHTKPFYGGGKLHRISGDVKHSATSSVCCHVQGEWNGELNFSYPNGETRQVDVTALPVTHKRVRRVERQADHESRRLWSKVSEALKCGDMGTASRHKHYLEEQQRAEEKQRLETNTQFPTKLFHQRGERWVYSKSLVADDRRRDDVTASVTSVTTTPPSLSLSHSVTTPVTAAGSQSVSQSNDAQ